MATILVTGASRGLGREFVRQYREAGERVIATCRNPAEADLESEVLPLDVDDKASVAALARRLDGEPVDILINNAGVSPPRGIRFGHIDYEAWERVLRTNTLGPIRVAEALVENVARSERRTMVFLSSIMGSIAENDYGEYHIYRSSKAALNMAVRSLAVDLRPRGIACALLHPGWVATDMGGAQAPLDPKTSVRGMRKVIEGWSLKQTGTFVDYRGKPIPW